MFQEILGAIYANNLPEEVPPPRYSLDGENKFIHTVKCKAPTLRYFKKFLCKSFI